MNENLIQIGNLCRIVRGHYRDHARQLKQTCENVLDIQAALRGEGFNPFTPHDLETEQEQRKHLSEMVRWHQKQLDELYALILRALPEVAPRLRLVGEPNAVNNRETLDFNTLESELRMIEAAAVQAFLAEQSPQIRLKVSEDNRQVTLDGEPYAVREEWGQFFRAAISARGAPVALADYKLRSPRDIDRLHERLRELLETQPGAGTRIPPEKLHGLTKP